MKHIGVIELPLRLIVDAWPVLEWVQGKQPAASLFAGIVRSADAGEIKLSMSRMNHGEVIYLIRKSFTEDVVHSYLRAFRDIPMELLSVPDELIDAAVELKSKFPISFADAFAAAQAIELSLPFVTGDRDFLLLRDAGLLQLYWLGA